ncbi:unnamed protein product [Ceutorhynchus assimilis]|uniref:Small ribosomal subunit protein mS40 n=1 Tax=Ceutorhynchus assimilis TaxID=467358 RepID=A0A9N9MX30_9CUCU|nr:unnamed protein product [Ceutorhynchus assimilis]
MFPRAVSSFSFRTVFANIIGKRELATTPIKFQQQNPADLPKVEMREITKDRTEKVPVETSIRYLKSPAYQQTYGNEAVWVPYKRNHKGAIPPRRTRRTCIRNDHIATGNPCPICRDEYLVLHEQNVDLLKQFISEETGAVFGFSKTGLCRKKQLELEVAIKRAQDQGLLTFDVPFRKYDYSQYIPKKQ